MSKLRRNVDSAAMNEDREIIRATIVSTPLFKGLAPEVIDDLVGNCGLKRFTYNANIWNDRRQKAKGPDRTDTPLMIIASGCAAVAERHVTAYEINRINALVMPGQLVGEFQFLGDEWPPGIEIRAFCETAVVFLESSDFRKLAEEHCKIIYKNLSETLKDKLNIANFHFLIAGAADATPKLAVLLEKMLEIPGWRQICAVVDEDKEYEIGIYWTYTALSQLLSCTDRSLKPALLKLLKAGAISIEYFNSQLKRLNPRTDGEQPKGAASFRLKVVDKDILLPFCEGGRSRDIVED